MPNNQGKLDLAEAASTNSNDQRFRLEDFFVRTEGTPQTTSPESFSNQSLSQGPTKPLGRLIPEIPKRGLFGDVDPRTGNREGGVLGFLYESTRDISSPERKFESQRQRLVDRGLSEDLASEYAYNYIQGDREGIPDDVKTSLKIGGVIALGFAGLEALDFTPGKAYSKSVKWGSSKLVKIFPKADFSKIARTADEGKIRDLVVSRGVPQLANPATLNRLRLANTPEKVAEVIRQADSQLQRSGVGKPLTTKKSFIPEKKATQPTRFALHDIVPKTNDGSLFPTLKRSPSKDIFQPTRTNTKRDTLAPSTLTEAMDAAESYEDWVTYYKRLPERERSVFELDPKRNLDEKLRTVFEQQKGITVNPSEPADSVLSYITPTGEKLYIPITKGELAQVSDEVANIPQRKQLSFGQIHLDANIPRVKRTKGAREVSRSEFIATNPEAAKVISKIEDAGEGLPTPRTVKESAPEIKKTHQEVAERYSKTDPKNGYQAEAATRIDAEPKIKNVARKASSAARGFTQVPTRGKDGKFTGSKVVPKGQLAAGVAGGVFGGAGSAQAAEDDEGNHSFNPYLAAGGALAGFLGVKYAKRLNNAFKNPEKPLPPGPFTPSQLPETTLWQRAIINLQDQAHRMKFLQKKVTDSGKDIPDEMNAYLQQEAYVGRASSRIEELHNYLGLNSNAKDGLFNRMRKDGITIDDLGEYMAAKNARARNTRVAQLTKGKVLDGSGLTNKEADKILRKWANNEDMAYYASEFRENIINTRLQMLREYGLYNEDQIARITAGEPDYVPAKIIQDGFSGAGSKGINARGRAIKGLKGSSRKDRTNAVIQAVADAESTIQIAEKNRVLQSLKKFIAENPDKKFWEVKGIRSIPQYDESGELQIFRQVRSTDPNTLSVWEDGKEFEIIFKDQDLADVFTKNSEIKMTLGWLRATNNYLRAVNTFMAPEFMLTNMVRDMQTAIVTAGGEKGAATAAKMAKDTPKAIRGIWKSLRKGEPDEWSNLYEQMKFEGGETGWFDVMTVDEQTRKTAKLIERYNGTQTSDSLARAIDSVGQLVRDTNTTAEMGVRVSAYKQLTEAGMSKVQAANYAKNMTVNFNKHGNFGILLNSAYLFANAGIQGSARLLTALRYKNVRRAVYGIAASSYAINEINNLVNPDGYERIQDFEKERNLIIMLPVDGNELNIPGIEGDPRTGYYFKMPLPYGFNVFKVAGDTAYDVVNKRKTPTEGIKQLLLSADAAYNPLSSGTPIQTITPTIADPFVSLWENKNWFGAPIMPEQPAFAPPVRDSDRYFSGARDMSVSVAQFLNRVTGGNEVTAGYIDVSPETLDHAIDTLGGSLGNFMAQTLNGTIETASGDVPTFDELPFIRKFIDKPFDTSEQGIVFDLLDQSATKRLSPIQVRRFAENAARAYEMDQIDADTLKRVTEQFLDNTKNQYAGEIVSLAKEGKLEEVYKVLESAPPGISEQLKDLVQDELEEAITKLQEE